MGDSKDVLHKLCHTRARRLALVLGMVACTALVFRTFTLPSMNPSPPAFTTSEVSVVKEQQQRPVRGSSSSSSSESQRVGELALLSKSSPAMIEAVVGADSHPVEGQRDDGSTNAASGGQGTGRQNGKTEGADEQGPVEDDDPDDDGSDINDEDVDPDEEFSIDLGGGVVLKKGRDTVDGYITLVKVNGSSDGTAKVAAVSIKETIDGVASSTDSSTAYKKTLPPTTTDGVVTDTSQPKVDTAASSTPSSGPQNSSTDIASSNYMPLTYNNSGTPSYTLIKKKKRAVPTASISEMSNMLQKARRSYRSMRPRWSSTLDQRILSIREQISNPPIVNSDRDLHGPAFRNLSMFKRSYDLMEKTLKVYIYREGKKPIFHQPLLKGIYASEGWFMKHMEGNRRFLVKDPRKALLFYMPFSSRFLEFTLYVPNSHNRTNLRAFLQNYVDTIAAKYPFWNRTGGTDHFLVACHDWAPYETKNTMERSIRALCNADLSSEFRLGKDVSLPETYVRFGKDPLRDLGGKPASQRTILAFYAGNMHGYLRPILLNHWENKDPDMKIYGPMPKGVKSKMNYIEHMKRSKYCICPRGYEVNSPRIVEAIFYECVPVIISDNYVPPFFEVLNWEAFAVFIAEADIPKLKDILLSIPESRYRELQLSVKKVQKHFIWHTKPVKYDLFHMTLHSVWYNRVHTLKPR